MRECNDDRLVRHSDTQLAFQTADDVLGLVALASREELVNDTNFLRLRLPSVMLMKQKLTALPDAFAISVRLWNTDVTVSGLGLNIVGWLFLDNFGVSWY